MEKHIADLIVRQEKLENTRFIAYIWQVITGISLWGKGSSLCKGLAAEVTYERHKNKGKNNI